MIFVPKSLSTCSFPQKKHPEVFYQEAAERVPAATPESFCQLDGASRFPQKKVLIWQFVEIFHFFSPKKDQKNCHFQTLLVLLKHDFLKIQGMAPCLSFSCRAADCRTHGICPVAQVMRPGNPSEGLESFGVLRQRSRSSTCMPF